MSEYASLIDQLYALGNANNYLRSDVENVVKAIAELRDNGTSFEEALLILPDECGVFLNWIGYLDIDIPEAFMDKFNDQIPWMIVSLSIFAPISSSFVDKYADRLSWGSVCWGIGLGREDLLRKHDHLVEWLDLSWSSTPLSTQFIYEYADKLHWDGIFEKKGFTYPYADMKKSRTELHEEVISTLYHPVRVSKWISDGNAVEDYLQ